MKYINLLIVIYITGYITNSWASSGFYSTPKRGSSQLNDSEDSIEFTSSAMKRISKKAKHFPSTPEGASSKRFRRNQIDSQKSCEGKFAARLSRYSRHNLKIEPEQVLSAQKNKWFKQVVRIKNNYAQGSLFEKSTLSDFGVDSNNTGKVRLFFQTLELEKNTSEIEVLTRPDGISVDRDGNPVFFEAKLITGQKRIYATRQLRAQEKTAREYNGRHVISIKTNFSSNQICCFPKPADSFEDNNMITEFRLTDRENVIYRWNKALKEWIVNDDVED